MKEERIRAETAALVFRNKRVEMEGKNRKKRMRAAVEILQSRWRQYRLKFDQAVVIQRHERRRQAQAQWKAERAAGAAAATVPLISPCSLPTPAPTSRAQRVASSV